MYHVVVYSRSTAHRLAFVMVAVLYWHTATVADDAPPGPPRIILGPYVQQTSRNNFRVLWETDRQSPATVTLVASGVDLAREVTNAAKQHVRDGQPGTVAYATDFSGLPRELTVGLRVALGAKQRARHLDHVFDTGLDYLPPNVANLRSPFPDDERGRRMTALAERIVAETRVTAGYCLMLGVGEGRLAMELVRRTRLHVVAVDDDPRAVAAARKLFAAAGVYGTRATVHQFGQAPRADGNRDAQANGGENSVRDSGTRGMPYADYLANLIVSERMLDDGKPPVSAGEVVRLLAPSGGTAFLGSWNAAVTESAISAWWKDGGVSDADVMRSDGVWSIVRRGDLLSAGEWSHQYGSADNSACSRDGIVGGDTRVLWFGQPGPRPMVDRGARTPAPLAVGGKLFVQGDRILFGLDAYNGTILWVLHVPTLHRANVPRDASNMAAGRDALYVAVEDACWKLDPATGDRLAAFPVPRPPSAQAEQRYDWGYVARVGDQLIGSAVKRGSSYRAGRGEWYDSAADAETQKVTSDLLFALDAATGQKRWEHAGGQVVNSTVTIAEGTVFFVESRNPATKAKSTGRLGKEALVDTYLVALDERTGQRKWESPVDFHRFRRVCYLAHDRGTLVAVGSSDQYHVRAFDATSGQSKWSRDFRWTGGDDHGRAMQHPTIVGGTVYTEFKAFDLQSGEPRPGLPPRGHGCGAQTASQHAFFYRGGFHTMWNIGASEQQVLAPARSGCWLSLIPAGGIVLAPETSSGCSCTHALQTSMAFVPVSPKSQKSK